MEFQVILDHFLTNLHQTLNQDSMAIIVQPTDPLAIILSSSLHLHFYKVITMMSQMTC